MHFGCVVLLDEGTDINDLMAPYYEEREVEPYERDCHCRDDYAARREIEQTDEKAEVLKAQEEELRERLKAITRKARGLVPDAETYWGWSEVRSMAKDYPDNEELKRLAIEEELLDNRRVEAKDALIDRVDAVLKRRGPLPADPNCAECHGKGTVTSTWNPDGNWDWFQIGGRWTGFFDSEYDPETDPANIETCDLCNGTGKHTTWPTNWRKFEGDVIPAQRLVELLNGDEPPIPFALVTPDGTWHDNENGQYHSKRGKQWERDFKRLVEENADEEGRVAVIVDCHT